MYKYNMAAERKLFQLNILTARYETLELGMWNLARRNKHPVYFACIVCYNNYNLYDGQKLEIGPDCNKYRVLISPWPDLEGNKLTFLSEWREFPSAPCLTGKKKTLWQLASRCCWNRARPWHASVLVSFLVGLRSYQHPGIKYPAVSSNLP